MRGFKEGIIKKEWDNADWKQVRIYSRNYRYVYIHTNIDCARVFCNTYNSSGTFIKTIHISSQIS